MVKEVQKNGGLPIKIWTDFVEESAMEQAYNLSMHPRSFSHIALMPDVHAGYGMPIGGVVAFDNAISPNSVGVDIGCGIIFAKTGLRVDDTPSNVIENVVEGIRMEIPTGFNHRDRPHKEWMPKNFDLDSMPIVKKEWESAAHQIGTLGGGNHFIELQVDKNGEICVMIHSGSRNIGKKVADFYIDIARDLNIKTGEEIPSKWDLAYLETDSVYMKQYLLEMDFCLAFAEASRTVMKWLIELTFNEEVGPTYFYDIIDVHHNYVNKETHFGKDVWVHRKGATAAAKGQMGIIPGSQGTSSYIVSGKGNEDSFSSCSHGAGRKMGRKEAKRSLVLEDEIKMLDEKGIIHGIRNVSDLDEAPSAYKDIDSVMKFQEDLVAIENTLTPLAVVKG